MLEQGHDRGNSVAQEASPVRNEAAANVVLSGTRPTVAFQAASIPERRDRLDRDDVAGGAASPSAVWAVDDRGTPSQASPWWRTRLTALPQQYRKTGEVSPGRLLWILDHYEALRTMACARFGLPMTRAAARSSATHPISRSAATRHPAGMVDAAMSVPRRRTP